MHNMDWGDGASYYADLPAMYKHKTAKCCKHNYLWYSLLSQTPYISRTIQTRKLVRICDTMHSKKLHPLICSWCNLCVHDITVADFTYWNASLGEFRNVKLEVWYNPLARLEPSTISWHLYQQLGGSLRAGKKNKMKQEHTCMYNYYMYVLRQIGWFAK